MEGSRRLGMVAPGPGRSVTPLGAECEITECQPLPDGCAFYCRKLDCQISARPLSDKPAQQRPPFCLCDDNENPIPILSCLPPCTFTLRLRRSGGSGQAASGSRTAAARTDDK